MKTNEGRLKADTDVCVTGRLETEGVMKGKKKDTWKMEGPIVIQFASSFRGRNCVSVLVEHWVSGRT